MVTLHPTAYGWKTHGSGQLQTYRAQGIRIAAWVGWTREVQVSLTPGSLSLTWRRYGP